MSFTFNAPTYNSRSTNRIITSAVVKIACKSLEKFFYEIRISYNLRDMKGE
jgi:hypothetical protein